MKSRPLIKTIVLFCFFMLLAGPALAKNVTLSWDASPSTVSGYKIYYKSNSSQLPLDGTGATQGASPIDVGSVLTSTITGLADGDEHYFAVTAYDAAGYESSYSNLVFSEAVVDDGGGGTNNPPVLGSIGAKSVTEGAQLSFAVSATDGDGDQLTYSATGLPTGATFNASTRTFAWTPTQAGSYDVTFSVADASLSDSEVVTITVVAGNGAPVLGAIGAKSVTEGAQLSFSVSATDGDGDQLTYSATGLPTGATFNASTRTFAWTPASGQAGSYSVTFSVSDGSLSDSETISVTAIEVVAVNQAPVLASIGSKGVAEGDTQYIPISGTDPDGDSLTFGVSALPDGAVFNSASNLFSWAPDYDQAGSYDITFTASDGSLNDSEIVTITVANTNRSPSLTTIGSQTVGELDTLMFSVNGSDLDADTLTFSAANLPTGATFNSSTRVFSWIPTTNQGGSYSVTVSVTDGDLSASEVVTITVVAGNGAPVLGSIGSKLGAENSSVSFTVTATDPDGDSLTYSASNLPNGASFNPATRVFSWIPDYAQSGVYSVTFSVADANLDDSEVVSITISDVNRPPLLAGIGTQSVGEGTALSFTISGFDPDNDGLTYSATDLPSGATFNPATRLFSWTSPFETTENTRIYPVTFTVSDGSLTDSETVTINVTNVNRAPVLDAIGSQSLTEGGSLNLVANATDPDANSLTYSVSNLPTGAVFTVSTRSLSWIPANDQAGSYAVTFTVTDGTLSDSEVVTISVANLNEAPVLDVIGSQSVNEGGDLALVITASDPENAALTYSASGLPAGASFDADQQRFSWTPDYTQAGNFTVTFNVTDGSLSDSETVAIAVVDSNQSPIIGGTPAVTVMASTAYSFTPSASDPDDDSLTFSISNKPAWASFDTTTGQLSGTPSESQIGTTAAIAIGASDGNAIVFLPLFSLEVQAYVSLDSDGDGVFDHLDAFPSDGNEWLDSDGDQIGNNADTDDDNDGVSDVRDGAPLDSSKSGWLISATTGSGGFITPEGQTSVLYGGSQSYSLSPMAGFYVNDLLVDNVSVGTVASYQFDNISDHHSIEAVFSAIPTGLSLDPTAEGLAGVERVDGGDDSNNLVASSPKLDLDYQFHITVREAVAADQRHVFLMLDGYRYRMELEDGALTTGAQYRYVTRLGPANAHQFYFIVENTTGGQLWRYPHSGLLSGPTVELLQGKNVIGTPGNIDSAALDSVTAFNVVQAYRWLPADRLKGSYQKVDSGGPVKAGEGYVLKRTEEGTLPDLDAYGEITTATHEIVVQAGWNLIANPYKGNVVLADVQIQVGNNSPQLWLAAAAENLVVDGVYYYLGVDWGNTNAFESAGGTRSAILTPWIGYWIYVNPTDQPVKLLIAKPRQ